MATFTRQVTDTLVLADRAIPYGAWERLTTELAFVDGETGASRLTTNLAFVDGETGAARLTTLVGFIDTITGYARATQEFAQVDGQAGTPFVTEEFAAADGTFGTPRVTEAFLAVDVASWAFREYTCVATDALALWDSGFGQPVYPVNWDIWGETDYYREVAALMRIESFTPFRYPMGPLRMYAGVWDWAVAKKNPDWPVPTFVQSTAYKYQNTTNPITVALNNVKSGNLVVVFQGGYSGGGTVNIADTRGNSWTCVGTVIHGDNYLDYAYYSFISNPGSMIISGWGVGYDTLHAFEFSGVNTLFQKTALKSGGTTICATRTLDVGPGLIVTAINWGGNVTLTSMQPDAGFTHIRSIAQNNGPIGIGVAYRVTTVAGDYPSGWTINPTRTPLGEFALAFKFVQV